jgi:DNA-binding LacI/PurR family transcriptional regulator
MCLGNAKQSGGQACAQHLLGQAPRITALFVANNLMTLGALVAIRERGLRIPADISIVGFDDMPWVPLLQVPLTVVAQPTYEMGQKAAELLLERIEQPRKPVSTVELKTTLIIRQSSGAVPQNSA